VKLFLGLLATMLAVGAASFWVWRAAPETAPCEDHAVDQARSPDGRTQAEVFEKRCGESVSTHVALRLASAPVQARTDVFIAAGSAPVRLSWTSGRELVLESPAQRVLVEEASWRNVLVRVRRVR
jgi:hypothetical protein